MKAVRSQRPRAERRRGLFETQMRIRASLVIILWGSSLGCRASTKNPHWCLGIEGAQRRAARRPALFRLRGGEDDAAGILAFQDGVQEETEECPADEVLLHGARYGDMEYVQAALDAGVPPDFKDSRGNTALHFAAANGHTTVLQFLLAASSVSAVANDNGNTPLHWSIENRHIECTRMLAEQRDAPVLADNAFGVSPLDLSYSERCGDEATARLLRAHPAVAQLESSNATPDPQGGKTVTAAAEESRDGNVVPAQASQVLEAKVVELCLAPRAPCSSITGDAPQDTPLPVLVRQLGLDWSGIDGVDHRFDTTGVAVWGASVVCARWLISEASQLKGKSVCEIGAGCGVPSLAASLYTDAKTVLATDAFEHAVSNLAYNLEINLRSEGSVGGTNACMASVEGAADASTSSKMQVAKLDWHNASTWPPAGSFDVIVGSDVLYDEAQVVLQCVCRGYWPARTLVSCCLLPVSCTCNARRWPRSSV